MQPINRIESHIEVNHALARVKSTLLLCAIAFAALLINEFNPPLDRTDVTLFCGFVYVLFLYWWITDDTMQTVVGLFLWGVTTIIFINAWINGGLNDSALIAYPGVIFLAFILGSTLLASTLILGVLAIFSITYYGHSIGLIAEYPVTDKYFRIRFIDMTIVLAVFSVVVYVFSTDLKRQLRRQNNQIKELKSNLDESLEKIRFDKLTKLPNEYYFERDGNCWLQEASRGMSKLAVVVLDIANMKQLNQNMG